MSRAARPHGLPRSVRLRTSAEFRRVLNHGRRLTDAFLQVWALRSDRPDTRLGLIVGRRHGDAVRRNFIKRLLREAFRAIRRRVPAGLDVAVAPQPGAQPDLPAYQRSLQDLLARLDQRLPRPVAPREPDPCPRPTRPS